MELKTISKKKLFLFIFLIILNNTTSILEIPLKLVKTKYRKTINKKASLLNNQPSKTIISDKFYTLEDFLFATNITIGSNNQQFTIILDTGSEILWVPGTGSSSSGERTYNPTTSISSHRTSEKLDYEYAYGTISGYYYNDQINFLLSYNFYAYFGVASNINLDTSTFDGIMGLGRKYSNNKYSILNTIKINGGITSTVFSFKYDYIKNELYFYLGEPHDDFKINNDGKIKTIASCPLIRSEYYGTQLWSCNIVSLSIKKEENILIKITFDLEGLFDTGTNNIVFPSEYISKIQQYITSFNCYFQEEGDNLVGSQKAIYCRDQNNLPKFSIGLKSYVLTLGKSYFYTKYYINNEYIYRPSILFNQGIDFCVIGQKFFYEYHTLFDDDNGNLKFYNEEETKIIYYEEKDTGIGIWVIILIIVVSVLLVGLIIIMIICFCFKEKHNIILEKELLDMSSIIRKEDLNDKNNENKFNKIMSIKSSKSTKSSKTSKSSKKKNGIKINAYHRNEDL